MATRSKPNNGSSPPSPVSAIALPVQARLDKVSAHLAEAEQLLSDYLRPLDVSARKRALKIRRGSEEFLASLAPVIAAHPKLAAIDFAIDPILERLRTAKSLAPLAERMNALARALSDTRLIESSEIWTKALEAYGISRAFASYDPKLASDLAPLEQFLKRPSARKRQPKASKAQALGAVAQAEQTKPTA